MKRGRSKSLMAWMLNKRRVRMSDTQRMGFLFSPWIRMHAYTGTVIRRYSSVRCETLKIMQFIFRSAGSKTKLSHRFCCAHVNRCLSICKTRKTLVEKKTEKKGKHIKTGNPFRRWKIAWMGKIWKMQLALAQWLCYYILLYYYYYYCHYARTFYSIATCRR